RGMASTARRVAFVPPIDGSVQRSSKIAARATTTGVPLASLVPHSETTPLHPRSSCHAEAVRAVESVVDCAASHRTDQPAGAITHQPRVTPYRLGASPYADDQSGTPR